MVVKKTNNSRLRATISSLFLTLLVLIFTTETASSFPDYTYEEGNSNNTTQLQLCQGGACFTTIIDIVPPDAHEENGEVAPPGTQPPSTIQCSTDLPNVENAREIWDYLRSLGLPEIVVAGIIGNFHVEGGRDTGYDPDTHQDGGPAYGIAQWEPPRLNHLIDYAQLVPGTEADLYVQLDFMYFELTGMWPQGKEPQGPYSYTGDAIAQNHYDKNDNLLGATSPQEAALIFLNRFERAGVRKEGERQSAAAGAFEMFTGKSSSIGDCAAGGV